MDSEPPYDVVFFDCDSTLVACEGIDVAARKLPRSTRYEIEALTNAAMVSEMSFADVYRRRLDCIKPSRADVAAIGATYLETLLQNAVEVVAALHSFGKQVHIISGGLRAPVLEVAKALGIDASRVHAVDVFFDDEDNFAGFDEDSPLWQAGGKPQVIARIFEGAPDLRAVLIGDGATDLEAEPHLARFIAFGGVVRRDEIFTAASVHCESADLADLLPLILSPSEIAQLENSGD